MGCRLERSIAARPGSAFVASFSFAERSDGSSQEVVSTEKDESQKLQARTVDSSTAPHCEHVFVTGKFCAADASTPVRREHFEYTMHLKCQADKGAGLEPDCSERDSG